MPRIRSIKPDALQHRKVGALSDREFRLWVGLLTQADDFGRLIADANQLRVLVFGYHHFVKVTQVETALQTLQRVGLIRLYLSHGVRYADFPSWSDHQRVEHPTPSKYPPYQDDSACQESSSKVREMSGSFPPDRKGREGKGKDTSSWPSATALVALWNDHRPEGLPAVATLSAGRQAKAAKYLQQFPGSTFWTTVMEEYQRSSFLRGERRHDGHEGFRADFDWLLSRGKDGTENCVKVAEGKYRDEAGSSRQAETLYHLEPIYRDADIGSDGMPTEAARQREAARIARVKAGRRS